MLRLFAKLFRRPQPIAIVLYTRVQCHLCDDAKALIEKHRSNYNLTLEVVDVDSDPRLISEYGMKVPVVLINGVERFFGQINEVLFVRQLKACSKK